MDESHHTTAPNASVERETIFFIAQSCELWEIREIAIYGESIVRKTVEKCSYIREEFVIETKIASIRRAEKTFCEKIRIRCLAREWLVILRNNICYVYRAPNSRRKVCEWNKKKRVLGLFESLEKSEGAFALLVNTSCVEWTKNTWALKSVKGQSQRGKGRCEHRQSQSEKVLWKFQHINKRRNF